MSRKWNKHNKVVMTAVCAAAAVGVLAGCSSTSASSTSTASATAPTKAKVDTKDEPANTSSSCNNDYTTFNTVTFYNKSAVSQTYTAGLTDYATREFDFYQPGGPYPSPAVCGGGSNTSSALTETYPLTVAPGASASFTVAGGGGELNVSNPPGAGSFPAGANEVQIAVNGGPWYNLVGNFTGADTIKFNGTWGLQYGGTGGTAASTNPSGFTIVDCANPTLSSVQYSANYFQQTGWFDQNSEICFASLPTT